ncbi:hypothetical protein CEXT_464011 [Caerostris extrusa]|uniref:C2 domain-containing protein n=1 Tax=Caerostris extrusa TaxID=172846 RepID=A0AAV4M4Y6_CAEEX|nr:hypothetical protein CEXT_464011 [Caerostris extrusa]
MEMRFTLTVYDKVDIWLLGTVFLEGENGLVEPYTVELSRSENARVEPTVISSDQILSNHPCFKFRQCVLIPARGVGFCFCRCAVFLHGTFTVSSGRKNRQMHPMWSTNMQMRFTLPLDDKIDVLPYFLEGEKECCLVGSYTVVLSRTKMLTSNPQTFPLFRICLIPHWIEVMWPVFLEGKKLWNMDSTSIALPYILGAQGIDASHVTEIKQTFLAT